MCNVIKIFSKRISLPLPLLFSIFFKVVKYPMFPFIILQAKYKIFYVFRNGNWIKYKKGCSKICTCKHLLTLDKKLRGNVNIIIFLLYEFHFESATLK